MKSILWPFFVLLLIPLVSTIGKISCNFSFSRKSLFQNEISELAVSTKSDIIVFFNNGNEKTISFDQSTVLDISQVENETKALVRKSAASLVKGEDRLVWTSFLDEEEGTNDKFPLIPGVQKLLPISPRQMVAANQTSLLSVNDNDVRVLYQGTKILDVAFDACSNSLLMIDNKQVFISSLRHFNPKAAIPASSLSFTQLLQTPLENHKAAEEAAQLLTTHSGNVIILTENLEKQRLNSDGFAIKDADGQFICASDPSKAYNIRSIQLDNDHLYLTDAMNYLVWQLQLKDTREICDLKAWKRLSGQQAPQKLTILHQSQTCISRFQKDNSNNNSNQRNSYEIMSSPSTANTSSSDKFSRDDPCYNYCINGHCSTTTLGVPTCHCGQNFTGQRCENQPCFNYCLNQGQCNILEISLGTPYCTCPPGFEGKRCQLVAEALEIEAAIDYFQGFLIMSGINVLFLLFIVALAIGLICQVRKQSFKEQKLPKIIAAKKSSRPRVFSASSSSGSHPNAGKRNNNNGGSLNEAFNEDKSSGHMCQALISDDGVVLDLEDCCQMTVCDKPCIEASFRKPTHRNKTNLASCHGDSHNDLLANVEFY